MSDNVIGIHDLYFGSVNDITSCELAGSSLSDADAYDVGLVMELCADTFDIKDNFRHILDNTRNSGELMLNLFDLDRCYCRAGK